MAMDPKTRTVAALGGVVVFMGAMAWASIPLYNWFCAVTGYGGTTNTAEAASDVVLDREITVRFDANVEAGMPWEFRPVEREMTLKIGQDGLAYYEAYNPTDRPVAGQAGYNVAPFVAGSYFTKVQCFCFTEQVLQPGERVEMPVYFYVDPAIVEDRDAKHTNVITLSYTFYEIDLPEDVAQAAPDTDAAAPAAPETSVN
ncbi:cytochrome c oxidase assembly protein [Roseivivax sp. CAU 1761]